MEKYGFVYIWRDKKHNRYYIGMHWGTEDDGYICSSTWMMQAFNLRPQDFKRKIIERVYTNRKDLYEREKYWLSFIKDEEIKVKYYNLSKNVNDTWLNEDSKKSRREKISIKTKEAMNKPEVREKYLKGLETRKPTNAPETVEKRRQSMIKTMAKKFPVEQRAEYDRAEQGSDLHRERLSGAAKQLWSNRTEDQKREISEKISQKNKGLRNRAGHINTDEHRRKISESQKGKIVSQETRGKISEKIKGQKRTVEQRKAQSERIKLSWAKKKEGLVNGD